jgi:hypothetical protein
MHFRHEGNGHGQGKVLATDKGGWVIFYPEALDNLPERLPILLSQVMENWFGQRPQVRCKSAVGIVMGGQTVAIHAFYEQVSWPQPVAPLADE